jgi:hypothetical protein
MRKAFFSFLTITYVLLMLSASFGSLIFETSKKNAQIDWSECEEVPSDNEETTEDSREFDENIRIDFSFGLQMIKPNSSKKTALCVNLNGFHFPEIDSPPPQV